jgi:EAL domain-containing protein (putative c-di-GMP-specific phosphodiesterase class I)
MVTLWSQACLQSSVAPEVLRKSGANSSRLKLEITESLILEKANDTIAKMTALKSHGITFSMDDFGTGDSSLSQLKQLPLVDSKSTRVLFAMC